MVQSNQQRFARPPPLLDGALGQEVIRRYLRDIRDIRDAARRVAVRPDRARLLKNTFRLVRVRSHYLIVQVDEVNDRLIVARVLHSAMYLERHLPSD